MKEIYKFFVWAFSWAIFLCIAISAQEFKTIRQGIEYAEMTRGTNDDPVRVNLLRLDLKKVRLDVVHAADRAIGLEKTSSMARRYGAIAAINAGFFRLDKSLFAGDAAGVLQIDGRLLSESYGERIALGIINGKSETEVGFGHLKTDVSISTGVDAIVNVSGINRERRENEIVLFTPEFGETTLTSSDGTEFIVKTSTKNPLLGSVAEISEKKGDNLLTSDSFVISASGEKQRELSDFFSKSSKFVRRNAKLVPIESDRRAFFAKAEDITNGVPQLIKNGRIEITWQREKANRAFVEMPHPRTAVARLRNGKFLMVTIDGRQPGHSAGMNLHELAALLLELGALEAMNLDGGGSTTMFLDGRVVNRPSDKEGERSVGDAILVFPRTKK